MALVHNLKTWQRPRGKKEETDIKECGSKRKSELGAEKRKERRVETE